VIQLGATRTKKLEHFKVACRDGVHTCLVLDNPHPAPHAVVGHVVGGKKAKVGVFIACDMPRSPTGKQTIHKMIALYVTEWNLGVAVEIHHGLGLP
jgi:hypothetical protein